MRYFEIAATTEAADTWANRFGRFQRNQTKRAKDQRKLSRATASADQHHDRAAAQRAEDHDKIADAKEELTKPPA